MTSGKTGSAPLALEPSPSPLTEHVVATADSADVRLDGAMKDLLRLIRCELQMEVAFIAEFLDGRRVFRQIDMAEGLDVIAPGGSHPLEESLCQRVVDGRIPQLVADLDAVRAQQRLPESTATLAAHVGVPVRLSDGTVYGTLCCFSFTPRQHFSDLQLQRLQMSAQLAGRLIDESEGPGRQAL